MNKHDIKAHVCWVSRRWMSCCKKSRIGTQPRRSSTEALSYKTWKPSTRRQLADRLEPDIGPKVWLFWCTQLQHVHHYIYIYRYTVWSGSWCIRYFFSTVVCLYHVLQKFYQDNIPEKVLKQLSKCGIQLRVCVTFAFGSNLEIETKNGLAWVVF